MSLLLLSWAAALTLAAARRLPNSVCGAFVLADSSGEHITLRQRKQPASKIIDTFAFGNVYEREELLLRLNEMGDLVDEFHIVEGDRDFLGREKAWGLEATLNNTQFQPWQRKITQHRVKVPASVKGYDLQHYQREALLRELDLPKRYDPKDIILEGDLDEIVSRSTLQVLRKCEPSTELWETNIAMGNYYYGLGYTSGEWELPTSAVFARELFDFKFSMMERGKQIWPRPNKLFAKNNLSTGWHVGWTLNGAEGLANKILIHVEGPPVWARGFQDQASLQKFLEDKFLRNPTAYDQKVHITSLGKEDVPQVLLKHPDWFPNILRNVNFTVVKSGCEASGE